MLNSANLVCLPHLSLVLVEPVDVDEDGKDEDDDGDEEGGAAGELVVGPVQWTHWRTLSLLFP